VESEKQGVFLVKQKICRTILLITSIFVIIVLVAATNMVQGSNLVRNAYLTLPPAEHGKVVLVFIDRVGLSDLNGANTPNLDSLIHSGGIGLMTTNTGGSRSQRDAYLTMGAGTRVIGSDKSPLGYEVEEKYQSAAAGDYYKQISGVIPPPNAVVNLGYAQAIRNNLNRSYSVTIGALGKALREAGYTTAVIGSCDTPLEAKRYLVSFLMDDQGIVPYGFVNKGYLTEDNGRPFGVKTDYDVLSHQVDKLWNNADVIAIQLGDTSRAEDFRYEAADAMNEWYKQIAIEESDLFIGSLMDKMDFSRDLLLIVTALGPARDLAKNNRMTPVIIAGPGIAAGLLSSASTKRAGVITNLDIGATVLGHYGIPHQPGQLGSAIFTLSSGNDPHQLEAFNIRLTEIYNQRNFLLRSYVYVQVVLLILSLILIFFARRFLRYARACLLFLMTIPMSYLLLPVFHQPALAGSFILSWLLAAGITLILLSRKLGALKQITILCFAVVILLLVDQLTGARLIQGSPLGYDLISGARFYGIGNEYMGVLIGAVCTGVGGWAELYFSKERKYLSWLLTLPFILTLMILAHPGIGANVGGTISAAAALASFTILMWKGRLRLRHFIPAGIIIAVFITGVFLLDSIRAVDSQSHMGQTVHVIRENGLIELYYIAKRKIEMNIKLFRYTIWTRVFLLSLLSVILLIFRPVGIFRVITERHPSLVKGIASALIGCITALLVNDSGIVAAGTSMIYIAPPVLLIVMEHLPCQKKWKQRNELQS
jgi:hypothetical protein